MDTRCAGDEIFEINHLIAVLFVVLATIAASVVAWGGLYLYGALVLRGQGSLFDTSPQAANWFSPAGLCLPPPQHLSRASRFIAERSGRVAGSPRHRRIPRPSKVVRVNSHFPECFSANDRLKFW